jgi:hypothetical protein
MKVLGTTGDYTSKYICEVSHSEIERFLNLYYNKMGKLKVGDEVDLGRGHDFARETKSAMEKTQAFIESNKAIIEAIFNGIQIAGRTQQQD